jgi:hypothetical protein
MANLPRGGGSRDVYWMVTFKRKEDSQKCSGIDSYLGISTV